MIHSLLNGNGGNTLLCKGLFPVCELNLCRGINSIYPKRLCQYFMKSPQYLKYLKEGISVLNLDFYVFEHQIMFFFIGLCTETRPL